MSDDFYGLQLSITVPSGEQFEKGDMINIRGRDAGEFQNNLLAIDQQMSDEMGRAAQRIRASFLAGKGLGAQTMTHEAPVQAPPTQYAQPQTQAPQNGYQGQPQGLPHDQQGYQQAPQQQYQQPAPQNDGIPTSPPPHVGPPSECSHGQKGFIAKAYKNGKPGYWMAWTCPSRNRNDQHELEFISNR